MPQKSIIGLSQYAALPEYILRIGAILSGETIIPDIDGQSVEPQMNSEQPFVYIYFNLVKAVLEKSPFEPDLDMAIWSYWLVHRILENPNPDYAFNITNLRVPEPPLIAPRTVEILKIERDISSNQVQTEFNRHENKSRKEALIHRSCLLSFNIKEERINILSDAEIKCAFQYVSAASHLSTSDRLQIFGIREVIYLSALTKSFLDPKVQQLVDGPKLFGLLSNASTFSLRYNEKYYTMLCDSLSKMKSMFKWFQLHNAFEMRQENTTEQHITKDFVELRALNNHPQKLAVRNAVPVIGEEGQQKLITTPKNKYMCEWCNEPFTFRSNLKKHRQKHAQNKPNQRIAYIPAAAPIIKQERKRRTISLFTKHEETPKKYLQKLYTP
ncbi:hypothetical protein M441DRAFT_459626 [Trichoderma asperellum CBS 433.97]|uniref:C2H2-type domain-containing protein n=1 Tax=Trichoderma asperellum (strain ATCC 204424 / CBS 433.97 / NBRC 101777) TaxID=1042311 RepID=A0A2T3Z6E0_TRIA4|nr:hypothetical protein M441DRAFT_459626 [Trichoderma asperellum CBS 433.97]PTB40362.1 hypothetical protein M441DRAFT_459626 [Trichoderma asperellum CBS 433.97]